MIRFRLARTVVSIILAGCSCGLPDTLSLEAAIKVALEKNFDIRIARVSREKARNTTQTAVGALVPKADLSASITAVNSEAVTSSGTVSSPGGSSGGASHTFTQSVTPRLSWTLFDGLKMFYGYRTVFGLDSLAALDLRAEIEEMVITVIEAYFMLSTQQILEGVARQQLDISVQRLEKERAKYEIGGISRRQLLNDQVIVNADRARLNESGLAVARARNRLNLTLGRSPLSETHIDTAFNAGGLEGDYEYWRRLAQSNNIDLSRAALSRRIQELDRSIKRADYFPLVAVSASYGYSRTDIDYGETIREGMTSTVGLSATMNLFNGFRTRVAYKNSALDLERTELSHDRTQLLLESLVFEQWIIVENTLAQVDFETEAVQLADRNLEVTREQYDLGNATTLELRDAEVQFLSSIARLAQARYNARIARAQLERLGGRIAVN